MLDLVVFCDVDGIYIKDLTELKANEIVRNGTKRNEVVVAWLAHRLTWRGVAWRGVAWRGVA